MSLLIALGSVASGSVACGGDAGTAAGGGGAGTTGPTTSTATTTASSTTASSANAGGAPSSTTPASTSGGTGGTGGDGGSSPGSGGSGGSPGSGGAGGDSPLTVAACYADDFVTPPVPGDGPDYDQFSPVVGSHCMGTNHQAIEGVERVVFLGDSVTVGTPPTLSGDYYRSVVADGLAQRFGLEEPDALWRQRSLRLTQAAVDGAPQDQLALQVDDFVLRLRESVAWLTEPGRFPNGVFVVLSNMYEFTDGTGEVESCDVPRRRRRVARAPTDARTGRPRTRRSRPVPRARAANARSRRR